MKQSNLKMTACKLVVVSIIYVLPGVLEASIMSSRVVFDCNGLHTGG